MRDTVMQTEDDFLRSHLVVWTHCLHQQDGSFQFEDLLNCELFSSLMKAIWPPCAENETLFQQLTSPGQSDPASSQSTSAVIQRIDSSSSFQLRYNKWATLVRTLITFYEIALQQLVLIPPPDVTVLATARRSSPSKKTHLNNGHHPPHPQNSNNRHQFDGDKVRREVENVLRLILGCAVQADTTKEIVISYVTTLDLHVQDALRVEIESITHNRSNVFPLECLALVSQADLNDLKDAARCLSRLVSERNDLLAAVQRLNYLEEVIKVNGYQNGTNCNGNRPPSPGPPGNGNGTSQTIEEQAHLYLQVTELKNKLRQCQSELETKSELLETSREDLDDKIGVIEKMRQENADLQREVRNVRELRDELDALKQDSARAERLERENMKLREKTIEFDVIKKRLEELREENRVLVEVRTGLERKLEEAGTGRSAISRVAAAEAESDRRRKEAIELKSSLDASQRVIEELNSRCARITSELTVANERRSFRQENSVDGSPFVEEKSFSEQLEESVTTRLLTLELANERLIREMDETQQRFREELEVKLEKINELDRDLERSMFERNEVLQDREKIRHLLDRVRDGYESKLRVAFSLIAVIKQELLATPNGINVKNGYKHSSVPRNAKIICELLDQFSADLKAPVLTGENELSNVVVDEKLYAKIKELLINSDCLQSLEGEVLRLTDEVKTLTGEKLAAQIECKRLEVEGGAERVRELSEQRSVLIDERDMLNLRLTRCLETIDILQKRQDALSEEKQLLQVQLSDSEEAVDRLKQCLSSNSEALRLAEEEGNRLKTMLERVNTCMDQFLGLKGGVQEIADRLEQDNGAPRLVEKIVTASRWSDPKLKEMEDRVRDLQSEKGHLEREINSIRVEEGRKTGDLARDVVSMKNRLVELERENASLASENGSLRFGAVEIQRQLREVTDQLTEVQSLKSELLADRARLETELASVDDRLIGLVSDRELSQIKINDLEAEKLLLKQEVGNLLRQISELKDENNRLQNENVSQTMSARSALAECRVLTEQVKRSQAEVDQLKEAIETAQRSSSDSTVMLAQLQAENQELVLQRASLQNDHARLEEKFKQVFQDLRKYQAVNPEALLAKIEYLRQMNDRLEAAVQDMSDQMRLLLKHNEDLLNGKLKDSEKHNTEQKYYMEMLATVQRQKTALESKMFELWQEQQEKQRRRTSSTSIEQLVRKAKHLFQKNGNNNLNNGRKQGGEPSTLLTAPNSSTISPMFPNQNDTSSLNATDSASTTSNSDNISMEPEPGDGNDQSLASVPADENHADEDGGVNSSNYHNSSFLMSRSLSIDLFKTSSPLKSSTHERQQSTSNGDTSNQQQMNSSATMGTSLLLTSSQSNGHISTAHYGGPSRQTTLANVGRWVAVERPRVPQTNGSDSCSNYSDSSLRAFNGSDGSAKMKNGVVANGNASTRTLTSSTDPISPINMLITTSNNSSNHNIYNNNNQNNRPSSSASSGGTTGTGTSTGTSVSLPGMGGMPSLASAVAVVTIPAANGGHHSLLSPALSSSASGHSDDAIRPNLPGGNQITEEGSVWYEFGCV